MALQEVLDAMANSDELFKSAHAALIFAFHFSGQFVERSAMSKMAAPGIGSGKGLAGLDGAGQAGMIRARVKALGARMEAMLIARHAPSSIPCGCRSPCCSGNRTNVEWFDAITELADYSRGALQGTAANGLARRLYVERYFAGKGHKLTIDQLAEKVDINRQTAGQHYSRVNKALGDLESVANDSIDAALRDAGLLIEN